MKIFFHSSIFAKQRYEESYKAIVEICKKSGHKVFAEHMLKRTYHDTDKFSREEHEADFQRLTRQIKESDAMIVEGTAPSIGTGHYMTIALGCLKPALVLYQKRPHGVLVGDPNRLLVLKKYNLKDIGDLENKIRLFLKNADDKKLKNRFNLMLDNQMVSFLENKSSELKTSKADVVRKLITQEMDKH
ncbi:hypothetical protein KKB40_00520 [Patescibacteria group bacterium]|nr:hypothetical protein [Patescibacteria group bacterium]